MYATLSDVAALNANRTFTATSKPSASQVGEYLDVVSVELDSLLNARGFAIPVPTTATSTLKLLQIYTARGAYAMAEQAAPRSPFVDKATRDWEQIKTDILHGRVEPVDLPRALPEYSYRQPVIATPAFYRDQQL